MPLKKPRLQEILDKDVKKWCPIEQKGLCVKIVAVADFPTIFGKFVIVAFYNNKENKDHVAIIHDDVWGKEDVPVRLHSECLTGDTFGSLRCDCHEQLVTSLKKISRMKRGIVLYLRQEGRGIGLMNKLRAYQLQDLGYDTIEANIALGFKDDQRDYVVAAHMLKALNVNSVLLITNNPRKIIDLERHGVKINGRIPLVIKPNRYNKNYLKTKMVKSGHILDSSFRD